MNFIRPLDSVSQSDLGQKASRLRDIAAMGFTIPVTYIIPSTSQEQLVGGLVDSMSDAAAKLSNDLDEMFRRHADMSFVVRSSCSTEDLPFASAAGQYDTFLHLRSAADILTALGQCYRSLDKRSIHAYLDKSGVDPSAQRMAVIIQEMIHPEYAGVLYTVAPNGEDAMLVEYVEGLGTPVVAGTASPESLLIDRQVSANNHLAEQLRGVGLAMEKFFGRAQDIEWGQSHGELVLFQSRDIIEHPPLRARVFEGRFDGHPALRVSAGVAVGTLKRLSDLAKTEELSSSTIVMVDAEASQDVVQDALLSKVGGFVITAGGQLSHFAAVCRQFAIPVVRLDPLFAARLLGRVVVIDADHGLATDHGDLPVLRRKQLIFDAAVHAARRGVAAVTEHDHVEAVITSPAMVRTAWEWASRLPTKSAKTYVESIRPYDLEPREYCGISARMQSSAIRQRLQFKRGLAGQGAFRKDHEILIALDDLQAGEKTLQELGYWPRPAQERFVCQIVSGTLCLYFIYWPGATGVYLGVDAPDSEILMKGLEEIGIPEEHATSLDGTDLFQMFGIGLLNCVFKDPPTSMDAVVKKYC